MNGRLVALLALVITLTTGCGHSTSIDPMIEAQHPEKEELIEAQHSPFRLFRGDPVYFTSASEAPYILGSGDRIRVDIFGQANLSRIYNIDGGGFISMPLIGAVRASGLTTFRLASSIAARLRRNYLQNPKVTVEISTYRPFFILGEVRTPGKFPFVNGMTVRTAVAIAGGYSPRANEGDVNITRTVRGRVINLRVPNDYRLKPGDTVYVRERFL